MAAATKRSEVSGSNARSLPFPHPRSHQIQCIAEAGEWQALSGACAEWPRLIQGRDSSDRTSTKEILGRRWQERFMRAGYDACCVIKRGPRVPTTSQIGARPN